ncbi:MAG TPA: hypothetical protein EYQ24_07460, partial [Bacteroidetes bacterium]|nr:hypothetical protein [Bacteroidota bacterium]
MRATDSPSSTPRQIARLVAFVGAAAVLLLVHVGQLEAGGIGARMGWTPTVRSDTDSVAIDPSALFDSPEQAAAAAAAAADTTDADTLADSTRRDEYLLTALPR